MAINQAIANPMIADAGNYFAPIQQKQNALMQQYGQGQNGLARMRGANALSQQGDIGSRLMADLQRDFGLTPDQAAGVVGNLAHESGKFESLQEINPMIEGSRGGFGYAQWTGPRRRAFESWAAENGLDPNSYEANYGFLKYELTNTPEGRVLGGLRSASNSDDAARVFSTQFLRPGIPNMDNRLALARQYTR